MPKSFGTLEEGFVNFAGGTTADVFLTTETYGHGKIQCAIVEPSYYSSTANAGPQPPGTTYLSGSEWTFSQDNNETTTDPCGQFVPFSGTPANLTWPTAVPHPHPAHAPDTVTKGAILLAKNYAVGPHNVYLASSETNLFDPGKYLITFGVVRGQALEGIDATWTGGNNTMEIQFRKKVGGTSPLIDWDPTGWTGLVQDNGEKYTDASFANNYDGATTARVFKNYYRSIAGIGGPYKMDHDQEHQGIRGGGDLADDAVYHFKRGMHVPDNEYYQIRWQFPALGAFNGADPDRRAVGLCDTIIQGLFKDYGDNYGHIQISAQYVTDNHFRIYSSAPFWGQVAYSISS